MNSKYDGSSLSGGDPRRAKSVTDSHSSATTHKPSPALFRDLKAPEIDNIRSLATRKTFNRAEVIVNPEEPALQFFLLEAGTIDYSVTTSEGRELLLRRLISGDIFGVAAFLSQPVGYLGLARSVDHSRCLVWDHYMLRRLVRECPQLGDNALRIALSYVALYARRHIALVSNTAQERVASALASLASRTGHTMPTGIEVGIKNEDLAALADVNFFTVSRLLGQWTKNGTIVKTRGKVLICRPEHLLAA